MDTITSTVPTTQTSTATTGEEANTFHQHAASSPVVEESTSNTSGSNTPKDSIELSAAAAAAAVHKGATAIPTSPSADDIQVDIDDDDDDDDDYEGGHGRRKKFKEMTPKERALAFRRFITFTFGCLGVVYGDLATSPLYTYNAVFHEPPDRVETLGILSLVLYSVTLLVTIKFVIFILAADNKGEGGVFALTAMIPQPTKTSTRFSKFMYQVFVFCSIAGAAFVLGDGVITPPISVLSALEGISAAEPSLEFLIVPFSCIILLILFMCQRFGTSKVGYVFSPVMFLWCVSIAILGIYNLCLNPDAFNAFNPMWIGLLFAKRKGGVLKLLGGAVLALTGVEAMYSDLGHFGAGPIRTAWLFIVYPAVLLSYGGQSAVLLKNPQAYASSFYFSTPSAVYWPMLILATCATIIASQALITGSFSLVAQAIHLGYFPRLKVAHTSKQVEGQIYIPEINFVMMCLCILLVLVFKKSAALADAFGLAVCGVLVITTILYVVMMRTNWKSNLFLKVIPFTVIFFPIDVVYFVANASKLLSGAWIPIVIGIVFTVIMMIWKTGNEIVARKHKRDVVLSYQDFMHETVRQDVHRVHGVGVFLTNTGNGVPSYIYQFCKTMHVMPETVVFLQLKVTKEPFVDEKHRYTCKMIGAGMYKMVIRHGFFERKVIVPDILRSANVIPAKKQQGGGASSSTRSVLPVRYYVPNLHLAVKKEGWLWRIMCMRLFIFMHRNSRGQGHTLKIPVNEIVELGTKLEL